LIFLSSKKRGSLYAFPSASILPEKPNTISIEAKFLQTECVPVFGLPTMDPTLKSYIQYLEIDGGRSKVVEYNASCLGNIRATCNGLILLDNKLKKGGLIVMNPVTRKLIALPLGTLYPPHNESYGFASSNVTDDYKVVHLFRDELGFLSCEILILGTRLWREVNGPSFGLFSDFRVSMYVEKEKFHTIPLPKSSRTHDRIVETGDFLSFVTHEEANQIDIWILKGLGESWTKQHSITMGCIMDMVPLLSLRIKGDMIFKRDEDGSFYAYDFQLQVMRKVEMEKGFVPLSSSLLPHVNSLVSWSSRESCQDVCD
jgi:hypothetical protein